MMVVLAQEVTVNVPPDLVGRSVSVLALVVAVATAWVTYWQGREIRNIETREHEWQQIDRISASIEVTSHAERYEQHWPDGRVNDHERWWLRLRNSARTAARDVEWLIEGKQVRLHATRPTLEILHPGEHYDVGYSKMMGAEQDFVYTVEWTDDRGRHSTQRRIS